MGRGPQNRIRRPRLLGKGKGGFFRMMIILKHGKDPLELAALIVYGFYINPGERLRRLQAERFLPLDHLQMRVMGVAAHKDHWLVAQFLKLTCKKIVSVQAALAAHCNY